MHLSVLSKYKIYGPGLLVILSELCMRGNKNHFKRLEISEGWKGTGGNPTAPWGTLRYLYLYKIQHIG